MKAIEVKDLVKNFSVNENELSILKELNFSISTGEFWGIVGESGSGKTTLLNILGTLDTPTSGEVFIGGQNPFIFNDEKISHFRNHSIGFVFQQNNLLSEFSALENTMMPGLIAGHKYSTILKKAEDLLSHVNLSHRKHHFPSQLSGGEQQRVAVARALINSPTVILADEPTGNLDSKNAQIIHDLLFQLNLELKVTIVLVTHNQHFSNQLKNKIILKDGAIQSIQH